MIWASQFPHSPPLPQYTFENNGDRYLSHREYGIFSSTLKIIIHQTENNVATPSLLALAVADPSFQHIEDLSRYSHVARTISIALASCQSNRSVTMSHRVGPRAVLMSEDDFADGSSSDPGWTVLWNRALCLAEPCLEDNWIKKFLPEKLLVLAPGVSLITLCHLVVLLPKAPRSKCLSSHETASSFLKQVGLRLLVSSKTGGISILFG